MSNLTSFSVAFNVLLCLALATTVSAKTQGRHEGYAGPGSSDGIRTFSILSFGAAGDGVTDDSKALVAAWKVACRVPGATVLLPSEHKFLIYPITLQGPCNTNLILQIDGTILALPSMTSWPRHTRPLQWLNLKCLHGFTIQGSGKVDGQSNSVQGISPTDHTQKSTRHWYLSGTKPTLIRFYNSFNITVRNIWIINSPQCHLKFDSSRGIKVKNITISSAGDSLNTDGIHLQNTRDVEIKNSSIGCGDDCVSIQTGCSNIRIKNINCNPGHGISLGGLGRGNSLACVSDVSADSIDVQNALYGVRIKTWQGGMGSVRNITFSNIKVSNVATPIVIDQFYCDTTWCRNKTDAVAISDVTYRGIIGTYSFQPVHIACSDSRPCTDVNLINVRLSPANESQPLQKPLCWKSYGEAQGLLEPSSISCLQKNNGFIMPFTKPFNYTC